MKFQFPLNWPAQITKFNTNWPPGTVRDTIIKISSRLEIVFSANITESVQKFPYHLQWKKPVNFGLGKFDFCIFVYCYLYFLGLVWIQHVKIININFCDSLFAVWSCSLIQTAISSLYIINFSKGIVVVKCWTFACNFEFIILEDNLTNIFRPYRYVANLTDECDSENIAISKFWGFLIKTMVRNRPL